MLSESRFHPADHLLRSPAAECGVVQLPFLRLDRLFYALDLFAKPRDLSRNVDRFRGQAAKDTGITAVFLGPRLIASHGKLSAELAAEFPVSVDNTALLVVPDYRLRGSFALRF